MKTMCGGLFSFCFLYRTIFGNGQIAITHNVEAMRRVLGLCVGQVPYSVCCTPPFHSLNS